MWRYRRRSQAALAAAGIQLFGGVSGDADEAVLRFVSGNLNYNPEVRCSHHAHEHSCGEHHCGENKTVAVAIEEMFIDEYPCLSVVKSWNAGIFFWYKIRLYSKNSTGSRYSG